MSAGRQRSETEESGEGPEALAERLKFDIARGLENVPVSAWPPGAWPEPFQVGGGVVRGAYCQGRGRVGVGGAYCRAWL